MNLQHTAQLLRAAIPSGEPVLLQGAPGLGKTSVVRDVATSLGYDCHVMNPALLDPTDVGGVPMNADGRLVRMLDDTLAAIVEAQRPTVLFLDELGQASPAMQAACAPIILDRKMGGRSLPEHVKVVAATNRRSDRAGVGGIVSHLVSRMMVVQVECEPKEWAQWAVQSGLRQEVVGFLRFRPSLLHKWDEETIQQAAAGMPYACPRSWDRVSRVLSLGLSSEIEPQAFEGCVGRGAATEFGSYLVVARDLPDIDHLLLKPRAISWKGEPSRRYALACAIAWRAKEKPAEVIDAAQAAHGSGAGEFAVLMLRDALTIHPTISVTAPFRALNGSPLGNALREV